MLVEVWNKNDFDYQENFRGNLVKIKSQNFIDMENEDAVLFSGTMNAVKRDVDGNPLPESYKRLYIVKKDSAVSTEDLAKTFLATCQFCGYRAKDANDLDKHIFEEHLNSIDDKEAVKALKKKFAK